VASKVNRVKTNSVSGSLGRVIYVIQSPLSKRDVKRFGMAYLRSRGFEVEAWNVAPIYLPGTENQWIDAPNDFFVRRFTSEGELHANCRTLTSQDKVILLHGVYLGQRRSHRRMIQVFSKSPAILGTVTAGDVPGVECNFLLREILVGFDFSSPKSWLLTLRRFAIWTLRQNSYRGTPSILGRLERVAFELRPLDFIWAGSSLRVICPHVNARRTVVRFIHSLDYEHIIERGLTPVVDSGVALYVDDMGIGHPDWNALGIETSGYSDEKFFSTVRRGLTQFEIDTGLEVVIGAHPRAAPGCLDGHYGGRKVVHGRSIELVAACQVVLMPLASTLAGTAVVFDRPIILFKSVNFLPIALKHSTTIASELKVPLVDIDAEDLKFEIPEIDKEAYALYKERYVKNADSIDLPFWEVVARDLGAEPVNYVRPRRSK